MDTGRKRNLSELSDIKTPSPLKNQAKAPKMSDMYSEENQTGEFLQQVQDMEEVDSVLKDMTMEQKVDEILKLLKVQKIASELDIKSLQTENENLKLHLKESDGLITKLSTKVAALESKLESVQTHSMKKNVVIYNLKEENGENCYALVEDFLANILQVPQDKMFSRENPCGPVRIDIAHRMGRKGSKPRPLVVAFVTQQGKDIVLSHSRKLRSTPFALSEQLPSSVRERRMAQVPTMTKLRQEAKDSDSPASIKLVKDKLIVNDEVSTQVFESNPIKFTTPTEDVLAYDAIQHSARTNVKNSIFQGHFSAVHTQKEAVKVLRALHQNEVVADSDHVIYAYRYTDLDGEDIEGYSDDGEWTASKLLMDILKMNEIHEAILVVTRKFGGKKLGKQRFEIIKQVATAVIGN